MVRYLTATVRHSGWMYILAAQTMRTRLSCVTVCWWRHKGGSCLTAGRLLLTALLCSPSCTCHNLNTKNDDRTSFHLDVYICGWREKALPGLDQLTSELVNIQHQTMNLLASIGECDYRFMMKRITFSQPSRRYLVNSARKFFLGSTAKTPSTFQMATFRSKIS